MKRAALLLPIYLLCSSYVLLTDYGFIGTKPQLYFESEARAVGQAKFHTHPVEGSHMRYADGYGAAFLSHPLTENNSLAWEVGYSAMKFGWDKNPRFTGKNYHLAVASLGWVSTSVERWRWIFSGTATVDTRSFNFTRTGVYYGLMWGRYFLSPSTGLHIGWNGHYGIKNGYVLPLFGIDYRFLKRWQLNLIFPIDTSLTYWINPNWSCDIKYATFGRLYRHPWRAHGGIGQFRGGIFEVYSSGAQFDLNYNYQGKLSAGLGVGWNIGGWIQIKDHNNHHPKYYKYNGAPYGRFTLAYAF